MTKIVSAFFFMLLCICTHAQDLYMPRDIKQAYKNGTRSMDGKPGKNYWQNHARYDITVTAMPPARTIKGAEKIVYFNNSPDTLRNPVIKLFINIHKPGAPRDFPASKDYLTDGITIESCTVNGEDAELKSSFFSPTWQTLELPNPLLPQDSITISFNWHYEISLESGREGMIDSTTYYLAYFYPRVAVLDDYNGWDKIGFVDSKEFYSDFNDYTVTVNVPKNYIVWGTGTLQQPEKLLQPEILKRFQSSLNSDETVNIVTQKDLDAKNVTAQNEVNSWQFTAANIPDMAFGISNHYVWDGSSTVVDDATGRRSSAQAAYNDTAWDFHYMTEYVKHSLHWLSHNWPGVPYPYEKNTVFQGYADMEYPMMCNDGATGDTVFTRFIAEHEIAHTYMPFYMGINESRYGFMDEGWATTYELLIGRADLGTEKAEEFYKDFRVSGWINDAAQAQDLPIITPADNLTGVGLGNNEYGKPSLGYLAAMDLLGDDVFKKCLHEYMSRWNGKHPIPWDFFFTFNNASGKNLNWFWNNWFFNNNYIDMAITDAAKTKTGYKLTLKNIGGMAAPVNVVVKYSDGSTETFHQTPAIWEAAQKQTEIKITASKKAASIQLDGGIFMDADESDNTWNMK